jgi:hypothetical protein
LARRFANSVVDRKPALSGGLVDEKIEIETGSISLLLSEERVQGRGRDRMELKREVRIRTNRRGGESLITRAVCVACGAIGGKL